MKTSLLLASLILGTFAHADALNFVALALATSDYPKIDFDMISVEPADKAANAELAQGKFTTTLANAGQMTTCPTEIFHEDGESRDFRRIVLHDCVGPESIVGGPWGEYYVHMTPALSAVLDGVAKRDRIDFNVLFLIK